MIAKTKWMKALLEKPETPVSGKGKSRITLRRLFYGAIIVCVLVLALLSAVGRLSMLMEAHDWMFGP